MKTYFYNKKPLNKVPKEKPAPKNIINIYLFPCILADANIAKYMEFTLQVNKITDLKKTGEFYLFNVISLTSFQMLSKMPVRSSSIDLLNYGPVIIVPLLVFSNWTREAIDMIDLHSWACKTPIEVISSVLF